MLIFSLQNVFWLHFFLYIGFNNSLLKKGGRQSVHVQFRPTTRNSKRNSATFFKWRIVDIPFDTIWRRPRGIPWKLFGIIDIENIDSLMNSLFSIIKFGGLYYLNLFFTFTNGLHIVSIHWHQMNEKGDDRASEWYKRLLYERWTHSNAKAFYHESLQRRAQ